MSAFGATIRDWPLVESPGGWRVDVAGTHISLNVERLGPCERWITHGEHRYRVLSFVQGFTHLVEVDGVPHRISRADAGVVRAPGPAIVVAVGVKAGEFVLAGIRPARRGEVEVEVARGHGICLHAGRYAAPDQGGINLAVPAINGASRRARRRAPLRVAAPGLDAALMSLGRALMPP